MPLSEKDLENIKDIVDFSVEKSEIRLGERIDNVENELKEFKEEIGGELRSFRQEMNREVNDLAEMNRDFLEKLGDHEHRIKKLELKTHLAVK